ncbi:unnamed protein product [Mytilus edulis]|uniref:Integrase core domain-containing protein n=1 Tax=Mytilus edulis TaxID=6550 RepID=A0A8S3R997_MYTED|nr:unnamed protein product [Mytilus edulis]
MTEGNKNRDIQREVSRIGDTFQLSFIKNSYSSCIDSLQKSANETLDDRNKAILLSKINLLHELNFRKSKSLEECYEEYLGMVPRKFYPNYNLGLGGRQAFVDSILSAKSGIPILIENSSFGRIFCFLTSLQNVNKRKWGMVIHGGIDGFSRMVTFKNLALDNEEATALEPFVRGCQEFGAPSRVRTDHASMDLWPIAISKLVLEDVGTEVDSMYFETLPDNCLEMILSDVQVWSQPSSSSSSGQTGDHSNAFRREFRQYFARQFKIIRVLNEEPEESGFQFSEIQNIYNDIFHNNSCEYADNEENETPENTDLHFDDFGLEGEEDEENYEFEEESLDFVGMLYDGAEMSVHE